MSFHPRVIITCGPSYEPIDQVRRLTNFSTGNLGLMLACALARKGYQVICFKGECATSKLEPQGVEIIEFSTNDHLHDLLSGIQERESVLAILHAAALCDFKIQAIETCEKQEVGEGKISSRAGEVHLTLTPALKLISHLRPLFPTSQIYGWKYEVVGGASEVVSKGLSQIRSNDTTACVVNGPAYGEGFGFLHGSGKLEHIPTRTALCDYFLQQLELPKG